MLLFLDYLYVLNRLFERPIDSIGQSRLLDKILSIWAKPICSTKIRVNGNEAYLLDELSRIGPRTTPLLTNYTP